MNFSQKKIPTIFAITLLALVLGTSSSSFAQVDDGTEDGGSAAQLVKPTVNVYGQGPDGNLNIYVWAANPPSAKPGAALVLIHGGGFLHGNPLGFGHMCNDIMQKGITCLSVGYTLKGGDGPVDEVKQAVAWTRQHAGDLHIDPNKIIVGGGSAGGYLALSTALVNPDPASMPNGLVLLNPVLNHFGQGPSYNLPEYLKGPLPPTSFFHGTADKVAPFAAVQNFVTAAKAAGSPRVDLHAYDNRGHGFWNYRTGQNQDYFSVMQGIIDFLSAYK